MKIRAILDKILGPKHPPEPPNYCNRCGGSGEIPVIAFYATCPECKGTGKASWR